MGPASYGRAIAFLSAFTNFETKVFDRAPKFDLTRMARLVELLGHPEKSFKAIHIAGTKGKGSCARIAAALLRKLYPEAGLYTSPHLIDLRERIKSGGESIPEDEFGAAFERARPVLEEMVAGGEPPTFFEVLTALAFDYFRYRDVKAASVEVGLGGRLDSTNVVNPVVSIITSISIDHVKTLGGTLEEIAREKAGIIREGVPVFVGRVPIPVFAEIEKIAGVKGAELFSVGRDIEVAGAPDGFSFGSPFGGFDSVANPRFFAAHQAENAALVLSAFLYLRQEGIVDVAPDEELEETVESIRLPGRLDFVPASGGYPDMIIDSAHNADSVSKTVEAVRSRYPGRKLIFALNANADKDIGEIVGPPVDAAAEIICGRNNSDRSASPEALRSTVQRYTDVPVTLVGSADGALEYVRRFAADPDVLVVFTGSSYWAGDVLKVMVEIGKYDRRLI